MGVMVVAFVNMELYEVTLNFVEEVYRITKNFPEEEKFGLISQMRRAAVSIPSNIAEGNGRKYSKEYVHFLYNARGSLMEIKIQIEIAKRLQYIEDEEFNNLFSLTERIRLMLQKLIGSIRRKANTDE
ncbi:MAG: four helix bundle protein [Kosmotoga sp.]|nr:MAG: four helix bundle protein [Kosmotoga sp.]